MLTEVTNDDWMDFWEGPTPEDLPTIRKPQMIEVEQEYIDGMIKRLEDAIDVCYTLHQTIQRSKVILMPQDIHALA